jgi:hypothetical protein
VLTDDELQAIARAHVEFETRRAGARSWWAYHLAKEVPALLRHITEVTAERDAAVVALQGQEQGA